MRSGIMRAIAGMVLAGVTLLAASACATAPGTDGNLVNEWPAMAAPEGWTPKAETCHRGFAVVVHRRAYEPISCTSEHRYETVFVGEFAGNAAGLPMPPAAGSAELREAWKQCDAKTTEFLGEEWRHGRIWIGVSTPAPGAWQGGARWFRCEAAAREYFDSQQLPLTRSLKGEFARESDLRMGCLEVPKDENADWTPVSCAASHNAEFVGVFPLNGSYDAIGDSRETIHRKCLSLTAAFVGVPDNSDMKYRTGTAYLPPRRSEWEAGDQSIRCYLWQDTRKLTASLKGAGAKALPTN